MQSPCLLISQALMCCAVWTRDLEDVNLSASSVSPCFSELIHACSLCCADFTTGIAPNRLSVTPFTWHDLQTRSISVSVALRSHWGAKRGL